jgi:hypothetical protein
MATYDSLASNNQFLADGMRFLQLSGEKVPDVSDTVENRENLRDRILSEHRWNSANLLETLELGKNVAGDNVQRSDLDAVGRVMSTIDNMPSWYQEGGAPAFETIKDYALASIADPSNIAGIVLGAGTFGFAGGASLAAKQAAKTGVKNYIKNKAMLAVSAPVLKAAAVESAITGAGSSYRSIVDQRTKVKLNLKSQVDPGEALMQGLIEGPISVLGGGVVATGLGAATKAMGSAASTSVGRTFGLEWMKNNLLPKSAQDAISNRHAEEFAGKSAGYTKEINRLGKLMEKQINKFHSSNKNETVETINAILDGKAFEGALESLHPELRATVLDSKSFVTGVQDYIRTTPGIGDELLQTLSKHDDYSRNVYEVFAVKKRAVPFEKFITKNPQVIKELLDTIASDPEFLGRLKADNPSYAKGTTQETFSTPYRDPETGLFSYTAKNTDEAYKAAKGLAKQLYQPKKGRYSSIKNTTETRKNMPEVLQKIWGKNYSPAQRVMQSVDGLLKRAQGVKLGTTLADSLAGRGLAVTDPMRQSVARDALDYSDEPLKETSRQAAARELNATREAQGGSLLKPTALVRLLGPEDSDLIRLTKGDINADSKYNQVWVAPETAANLRPILSQLSNYKPLFDGKHIALESAGRGLGRIQGVLKIGKTILSPVTVVRNGVGAALAMIGSGNPARWVENFARVAKDFSSSELSEAQRALRGLGVTGSSIDMGQILTRMGKDINEDPGIIEKIGTFGLAGAFPKTYQKAQAFYGGTDDFFKTLTYMSEYSKEKAIWDSLTESQRTNRLDIFRAEAGADITHQNYLSQKAAWNTKNVMPVYSRVPAITEHALVRSMPLIGNFSAYPSEMFRNAFNIYKLGAEELEQGFAYGNMRLISNGLMRMAAFPAVASAGYVAAESIAESEGTKDAIEALRNLVAPWDKYGALVITGTEIKNGRSIIKFTNLSYSNPYSPFVNVLMPTITALANGEPLQKVLSEGLLESSKAFVAPYTDPALTSVAAEALLEENWARFYKTVQPGFVKLGLDTIKDLGVLKSEKSILGLPLTPQDIERALYPKAFGSDSAAPESIEDLDKIISKQGKNLAGLHEREMDLTASMGFVAIRMSENYTEHYNAASSKIRTMLTDPEFNLSPGSDATNQMLEEYEDILELDFVKDQQLREAYEDMATLSGSTLAARKIFMDPAIKAALGSKVKLGTIMSSNPRFLPRRFFTRAKLKKLYMEINKLPPDLAASKRQALSAFMAETQRLEGLFRGKSLLDTPDFN